MVQRAGVPGDELRFRLSVMCQNDSRKGPVDGEFDRIKGSIKSLSQLKASGDESRIGLIHLATSEQNHPKMHFSITNCLTQVGQKLRLRKHFVLECVHRG